VSNEVKQELAVVMNEIATSIMQTIDIACQACSGQEWRDYQVRANEVLVRVANCQSFLQIAKAGDSS
jgi:hypothetical protein